MTQPYITSTLVHFFIFCIMFLVTKVTLIERDLVILFYTGYLMNASHTGMGTKMRPSLSNLKAKVMGTPNLT